MLLHSIECLAKEAFWEKHPGCCLHFLRPDIRHGASGLIVDVESFGYQGDKRIDYKFSFNISADRL